MAVTTQNYVTGTIMSHAAPVDEAHQIQTTFLSVICTEEVSGQVNSIITSNGGLSITSTTFLP